MQLAKKMSTDFLVASVACFVVCSGQFCTIPEPRPTFDMSMYEGRWYLIETGPMLGMPPPINCVYEEYTATENPYVYTYGWSGMYDNGTHLTNEGILTIPDESQQAVWDVFYFDESFKVVVVATDYSSWSIEYACNEAYPFQRYMIRSRVPTIDETVLLTLRGVVAGHGVDMDDFASSDQSNCEN